MSTKTNQQDSVIAEDKYLGQLDKLRVDFAALVDQYNKDANGKGLPWEN